MSASLGRCTASLRQRAPHAPVVPFLSPQWLVRTFHGAAALQRSSPEADREGLLKTWRDFRYDEASLHDGGDKRVGFLGKRRNISSNVSFADLTLPSGDVIQLLSTKDDQDAESLQRHKSFCKMAAHSAVIVDIEPEIPSSDRSTNPRKPSFSLKAIRALSTPAKNMIVTKDVQFPPEKRHLQIRFHPELQARLHFRSWLKGILSQELAAKGFTDIETPTLFKSTPEGAREFLVPTREKGKAYALSQSPQQYKQALMASGIMRYMQWARCYRDEDSRTDRQPEFTQLDMEWAFVGKQKVQEDVTQIVLSALKALRPSVSYQDVRGERVPLVGDLADQPIGDAEPDAHQFTNLTFAECLASHGSDKPDLRIPNLIHALPDLEPFRNFVGMITHLEDPVVEAFAFPLNEVAPSESLKLVRSFMETLPTQLLANPDGTPQILIYDTSKPLAGLSSLGPDFESIDSLVEKLSPDRPLEDGDLIVFQARQKQQGQPSVSSTKLGDIRRLLWRALVEEGHMKAPPQLGEPGSLQFLWVTEFPMFKMVEEGEPGQGGAAGIAAAHHPFTAPLSTEDFELLFQDPMRARSAAYDLVLNGVEIGGGSVRNHIAPVQRFIMRDILKMDDKRMKQFEHLFEVLESSCPPHAGFALGFDRLVALMSGTTTVRDVIAFPKTMKGEDLFVKSPSKLTKQALAPYGLRLAGSHDV